MANAIRWAILFVPLVLAFTAGPAAALECTGRVVLDRDRDGRADPGERGIAGVAVTDGRQVARTGADGRYRFEAVAGSTVQLVKPAGFSVPARGDGLPDTWRHLTPDRAPSLRYGGLRTHAPACRDFVLRREAPRRAGLDVLLFGDPQPKTAVDVGHFRRDIVEPLLAAGADAHLGVTLGDVASDDLSLLEPVKAQTVRLGLPWLHVPGNHDLDFDAAGDEDSLLSYREAFGGDTFAWEEPEAVFVGLDNVVWRPATRDYVGGLREAQFEFLRAYLATAPRERLLVIAAHIPFFDDKPGVETFRRADRERLFALLAPFPRVLLLTAHGHVQRQYRHGAADGWHGATPLPEFNAGATCGAYWSGRPDAAGIPDSTMADGTPNGYARLHVDAVDHRLSWHPARASAAVARQGMALHAPRVLRRGAYPAFGVFANVWLGDADTRVEFRVDDGAWQPMRKVERGDPALQAENALDDTSPALRGFDRSPEAAASSHLWRGTLPTDLAAGTHRVEVRANGYWVRGASASTEYRLDEVR